MIAAKEFWQKFVQLTQKMLECAAIEKWDQVAALAVERQKVEQALANASVTQPDAELAQIMEKALEKNNKLAEIAARHQGDCQSQMTNVATGKKATAAYSF